MDHFAKTNNIQLHYLEHPGGVPPIVLLPGLTANAHVFDGLIEAGLSPRFCVLALDLRGRGLSDAPATGYTMANHAADVIGLLDALDLPQVVLVGHSFGGMLSLYIAAHYPERVAHIVVMDAGIALAYPQTRDQIKPSLDRLGRVFLCWEDYLEMIKDAPYLDGWWEPTIESYFQADIRINSDNSVQTRSRPDTIAAAMEGILAEPWTSHLASVRHRVVLINAIGPYGPPGAPPILSAEAAQETVTLLNHGRYVLVSGNHITMLYGEGAKQIVEVITSFVTEENHAFY